MDTEKHPRIGRTPGKSHHDFLITLDMIHQGRMRLGEAHTANDGVHRTALQCIPYFHALMCLVGYVVAPLTIIYPHVKSPTDISRFFGLIATPSCDNWYPYALTDDFFTLSSQTLCHFITFNFDGLRPCVTT
jgi:hypothetical protein